VAGKHPSADKCDKEGNEEVNMALLPGSAANRLSERNGKSTRKLHPSLGIHNLVNCWINSSLDAVRSTAGCAYRYSTFNHVSS